ncbi:hypothetical protein QQF64_027380 [Cirrhinus molitorella]|uniref:Uncharacterized protein n=1 Tax=Cirrhinus molitorella TaxID=172907 RepID=A0ABR3NCW4_9TELE
MTARKQILPITIEEQGLLGTNTLWWNARHWFTLILHCCYQRRIANRLWNGAEKFFHAVIPALGVSLLQIEVEITRYELISFMNTTKVMVEGIKEELRGLRWTALQNRLGD